MNRIFYYTVVGSLIAVIVCLTYAMVEFTFY